MPDGRKESSGGPWHFVALMPLFDPPRHDSAETIRRALNLGVNVKMITGTAFGVLYNFQTTQFRRYHAFNVTLFLFFKKKG